VLIATPAQGRLLPALRQLNLNKKLYIILKAGVVDNNLTERILQIQISTELQEL
jgi:hypothetical protein